MIISVEVVGTPVEDPEGTALGNKISSMSAVGEVVVWENVTLERIEGSFELDSVGWMGSLDSSGVLI